MARKKILVLTPRYPYPVIGGDRLRIYEVCKAIARDYDLTLLSLCDTQAELHMTLPDDGVFCRVERVLLSRWQSYLNCLLALPTGKPLQVAYYQSAVFRKKYQALVRSHDGVFCHLIRTADYALGADRPLIVEFTDAISLNYSRVKALACTGGVKNVIYSVEQARLERYEKAAGKVADLNVFVSAVDADHLFSQGAAEHRKTLVCSNGVDVNAYPFVASRYSKEICFIGNMQSVQNMDAALWFAKNVMPFLVDDGFTFKVVGRISVSNQNRLNSLGRVTSTGGVVSVIDAVKNSFIGVCPMRIGAGVQNKILEYMSLGLPCITSSMGYEGLQAVQGQDLFVLDKPEDIADQIRGLHGNLALHQDVATNARNYVVANHSWTAKLAPLKAAIGRLI